MTLSHYKILEKLGAGGMGEVYRAEDLRLHRQVAVKILPDIFSADPERLARFEREAKLLAALSHPNIAAIYGLEEAEGKRFFILELVEGETLTQRLAQGPLPVDEALDVCRQIADGLEAAHEKNIVHRDLKPSNIKITPEEKVEILDFGLARAFLDQSPSGGIADSPTITAEMTQPGVILGTAAYMCPEQAKGKQVDKRADIWAFGCILYECLTAKMAFPGETITEVFASILKGEPDWDAVPKGLPANVRAVLSRCLQKDRNLRYHDIADARIELSEAPVVHPSEAAQAPRRPTLAWLATGAAVIFITGILIDRVLIRRFRPQKSQDIVRSVLRIEQGRSLAGIRTDSTFQRPTRTAIAASSDGRSVVYSAAAINPGVDQTPRLYLHRLDKLEDTPIRGTDGGINPFFSPDDRWIGFWANGKLLKVVAEGQDVPVTLCAAASIFGASWGSDGTIVYSPGETAGLFAIPAEGGEPRVLTSPDSGSEENGHRLPHELPDARGALFTITRNVYDNHPRLAAFDARNKRWRVIMEDAADGRYVGTGHLIFLREGVLMAAPFDLSTLTATGQAVPILPNVEQALGVVGNTTNTGAAQIAVSRSGLIAYIEGGVSPDYNYSLVRVDQRGRAESISATKAFVYGPRISPDGTRIAYFTMGRDWRLWIRDIDRGTEQSLTRGGWVNWVTWLDNRSVVLGFANPGRPNLYRLAVDGSSALERLTTSPWYQNPSAVSPDGKTVVFVELREEPVRDIFLLDIQTKQVIPFLGTAAMEVHPAVSPGGRWLAYASDESGRVEVYIRAFPKPDAVKMVSLEGGNEPVWSPKGNRLFFRRGSEVWAVEVHQDNEISFGRPIRLFDQPAFLTGQSVRNWDVYPDGNAFLMVQGEQREPRPATEMILVQNWFEELTRLVPAKK